MTCRNLTVSESIADLTL